MRRRLSDPAWKSGPKEPRPTAGEHAIHEEDFGSAAFDFDGFGKKEAERVDGEPLITIRESVECHRDGCEAAHSRVLLFTSKPLSEENEALLRLAAGSDSLAAFVWEEAERVDVDAIEVFGVKIPAERIEEEKATGSCYGRVEPDPEPYDI